MYTNYVQHYEPERRTYCVKIINDIATNFYIKNGV